jgi:quercetin dioxygenase-like cupin family protein
MPQPIIIEPSTAPRPLNVVGETITVLASGDQTGSYEVFDQVGVEGRGPPPHSHPWDEAFYVINGAIEIGVGDTRLVARPGSFVHVPAGEVHWFRFAEGGGEMLSLTSCAGAAAMFTAFDREISPDNPDFGRLAELANAHGAKLGAPSA